MRAGGAYLYIYTGGRKLGIVVEYDFEGDTHQGWGGILRLGERTIKTDGMRWPTKRAARDSRIKEICAQRGHIHTWKDIHKKRHTRSDIMTGRHTHGRTYTRTDIHMEEIHMSGHAHKGDIYSEGHTHEGIYTQRDIHTERYTHGATYT